MLIVDDEGAIRALCRVILELEGLDVVLAANGAEALALIDRDPPDIVLLDVMMPEVDGWQVAERLRSTDATRDLPIVFLTARAAHDDRRRGFDAGAVAYIVKPFDPVSLTGTLLGVLDRIARGEREELRRDILEEP